MTVGSLGDSLIKIGNPFLTTLCMLPFSKMTCSWVSTLCKKWSAVALQQRRISHEGSLTKQPMQRTFTTIVIENNRFWNYWQDV